MMDLVLKPGRDRSLRRRHPWLLSGAVASQSSATSQEPGQWVRVVSAEGEVLGFGDHSPRSGIRVRMLSFGKDEPAVDWLENAVAASMARRENDPLLRESDAFRVVNGEGDGLPGLIADRYGEALVVKLTSAGMHARSDRVAAALERASGASCGLLRADPVAARREGIRSEGRLLWGDALPESLAIREGDCHFQVDPVRGQKTGFYLDQRDARKLAGRLAKDRDVLDLFSFTGAFATVAARMGARRVTLVDSSGGALEGARAHLAHNAPGCEAQIVQGDAFAYLRESEDDYDLLIVDPPPLARRRADVPKAARAYKDLLLHALRRARPGAFLLVFSCSHHVGPELFRKIVFGASIDARRSVQVLGSLGAPSDHPVSLDHPEGHYLSGFLLRA